MEMTCIRRRRAPTRDSVGTPVSLRDSARISSRARRGRVVLGVAVVAGALLGAGSTGAQAAVEAHAVSLTLTWTQTLNDAGGPIALSSPNVATLAGGPSVVVGDRAGNVYAFNLASGAGVPGWPVSTGGVPVDSTPSVADTGGSGLDSVFVGEGNAATPTSGGYLGITPQGGTMWFTNVQNPSTDTAPAKAVQASMAVGNLNGGTDVVAGSLGEVGQAMNASNGAMLPGFPWFQADSNFTTPGLGRRRRATAGPTSSKVATPRPVPPTARPTPTAGTCGCSAPPATPAAANPGGGPGVPVQHRSDRAVLPRRR